MDDNFAQPEPLDNTSQRRFVYRAVQAQPDEAHPMRRSTDTPRRFQGAAGEICPKPVMLKMRVYMKVN